MRLTLTLNRLALSILIVCTGVRLERRDTGSSVEKHDGIVHGVDYRNIRRKLEAGVEAEARNIVVAPPHSASAQQPL